jgi:hypothetical protein
MNLSLHWLNTARLFREVRLLGGLPRWAATLSAA